MSGSLCDYSSNTNILRQQAGINSAGIDFSIYNGLADLSPFNLERNGENHALTVANFHNQLAPADAVIICTPE